MLPRVNLVRTDETDYLLFSTDDTITVTLYRTGHWAKPLADITLFFCSGLQSPLILDVGANLGAYAVPVAQRIAPAGGVVLAYEPQRIVFYQLCANTFLNRLDNLHAFHLAIGDDEGWIEIPDIDYQNTGNVGSFSLDKAVRDQIGNVGYLPENQRVRLERLDALTLPGLPSLLKIDVEGLEIDVLKGAQEMLKKSNFPPIMLEAWKLDFFAERRSALLSYIHDMGYTCFFLEDEIIAQHPAHHRQFELTLGADFGLNMHRVR